MVLKDEKVEPLIEKLCEVLRTNKVGDGKIFIYPRARTPSVSVPVNAAKAPFNSRLKKF